MRNTNNTERFRKTIFSSVLDMVLLNIYKISGTFLSNILIVVRIIYIYIYITLYLTHSHVYNVIMSTGFNCVAAAGSSKY